MTPPTVDRRSGFDTRDAYSLEYFLNGVRREEAEMTGGQGQREDQNGDGSLIGQASVWISLKLQSF